ncbi:MAG: acyl-protein synthetase [Clostridia bacterium]|nr:acyl-protein synthetase [Clostridia bacterium]MBQ5545658.1 acyl-protein synthetase [Clostridia bacterium]
MKWMNRLFRYPLPYDTEGSNELFLRAVRENCRYQYLHNAKYRAILDGKGFHPSMLRTYDDIAALPVIPTLVFKHHAMYTLSPRRMPVKATSSGTGGAFSRVGFAWGDLRRGLSMVLRVVGYRRLFSLRPANYIVFGYKPHRSNHTAVTKTAFGATLFTPQLHRTYALRYTDGRYVPDLEGVIRAILRFSRSRFPLRFMGFPSYTYFAMRMLDERGISLRLPKGSKIMLGGGWKQFYREAVDKSAFYALAKKVFNIDDCNIVEFFGAVEHPILYCDCPRHHFHVPVYGRVIIRDVNTLAPLPYGHMGLVNLVSPMVMATPILSVMTDDLGVLRDGRECGCGLTSPYLEIIGRVGLKDIKTCAAGAADILKETGGSV